MKLIFATNNYHKLKEVQNLLGDSFKLLCLRDINCNEEIPENQDTIEGNASQKAFFVYNKLKKGLLNTGSPLPFGKGPASPSASLWRPKGDGLFADDTGLEIEALNGRPGVFSARYAGEACDFDANIAQVLKEMQGVKNRKARFRTIISLIIDGKEHRFEGIVNGIILTGRKGGGGFGYDPIFQADGFDLTYAEMSLEEKNKISHRAMAVKKLADFFNDSC